jgi:type IV secretory pathway TraG/TraD family ATPase VirD4
MQLPEDDELVFLSGKRPIRAGKLRYYADQNFTPRRLDPPPPNTFRLYDPASDWDGLRAFLHADLMLDADDSGLSTDTEGGREHKPELDAKRTPQQDAPDVSDETQEKEPSNELDAGSDAQDADSIDNANDIGMLGRDKK